MKHRLSLVILLSLLTSLPGLAISAAPTSQNDLARSRVKKLVNTKKSKLTAQGCAKIPPTKWASLIFFKQPIDHDVSFKEGCDIQGHLHITEAPFQVELEVRNLDEIHHVGGRVKVDFKPRFSDHVADVDITVSDARALDERDAEVLALSSTYGVTLGLDGKMKKNRGGRLKASRFHGKPVDVTERVRFE